jgi:hypothetical protein
MSVKKSTVCYWSQDGEDGDTWATQCGHYFALNEGTPSDNKMDFCCYCGRQLLGLRFEDDEGQP